MNLRFCSAAWLACALVAGTATPAPAGNIKYHECEVRREAKAAQDRAIQELIRKLGVRFENDADLKELLDDPETSSKLKDALEARAAQDRAIQELLRKREFKHKKSLHEELEDLEKEVNEFLLRQRGV